METFKIGICEPEDFSLKALDRLSGIGEVSLFDGGDLETFIADKDAIFIRLKYAITDELLLNASKLKFICSPTTGLNHIQLSDNQYKILCLKGEYEFLDSIRATPEHVFGLTLGLLRNYSHAFLNQYNREFNRNPYKGFELYGNTVGIIGFGRVGKLIAKYFNAFDSKVMFCDIEKKMSPYAEQINSLDELIRKSNIVILAANYTKENENMISSEQFSLMRDKYFINAARGELVDEQELLEFLQKDWFRGVAIDVIANETQDSTFLGKLLELTSSKNLIITPHIGGATYSSMERTEEFIAEKLIREYQNGGK